MESEQITGRILVVDDEENNRDLLSRRLMIEGHQTGVAANGQEAVDEVNEGGYDLVLLDIMMPVMSGIQALQEIRKTHTIAELPIIMATAKTDSKDIVEALKHGANDYVTKPLDMPVVLARVTTQLSILCMRRELERLSAMKDDFLAIASHDLKGPLGSVLGFMTLLRNACPPGSTMGEDHFEFVERTHKAALTMKRIVEDFLDFQAMEEGRLQIEPEEVSLADLAQEVIEAQKDYAASKDITVNDDLPGDLPKVNADPARLDQVLQNFIGNAIKFGPSGTAVKVRASAKEGKVLLEVIDDGPGLSDEDLGKLFQKYSRLSNKPTGGEKSSGLGLAICKQLVEEHGGEVGARNNPEGGATFWFSLPLPS